MADNVGAAAQGAMVVFGCGGVTRAAADSMRRYLKDGLPMPKTEDRQPEVLCDFPVDYRYQISLGTEPNPDAKPTHYQDVLKVDMNRVLFLVNNLSKLQELLGDNHPVVTRFAAIGKQGNYNAFFGPFSDQRVPLKTEQIMGRFTELGDADDVLMSVAKGTSRDQFFSTIRALLAWPPATDDDYVALEHGALPDGKIVGGADAGGARRRDGMSRDALWGINADQAAAQMLLLYHLKRNGQLGERVTIGSLSNPQNQINLLMQETAKLLGLGDAVVITGGGELDAYRATLATQYAVARCKQSPLMHVGEVKVYTVLAGLESPVLLRDAMVLGNHGDDQVLLLEKLVARVVGTQKSLKPEGVVGVLTEASRESEFNKPETAQTIETIQRYLKDEIGQDENPENNRVLNGTSFSVPKLLAVLGEPFGDLHRGQQEKYEREAIGKMPPLTAIAVRTKAGGLVDQWKLGKTNVEEAGRSLAYLSVVANQPSRTIVRACAPRESTSFAIGPVEVGVAGTRLLEPPYGEGEEAAYKNAVSMMEAKFSREEAFHFAGGALERITSKLLAKNSPLTLHPDFLESIRQARAHLSGLQ